MLRRHIDCAVSKIQHTHAHVIWGKDTKNIIQFQIFRYFLSKKTIKVFVLRYLGMGIVILLFIGAVAAGFLRRRRAGWYEYLCALAVWLCIGFGLVFL